MYNKGLWEISGHWGKYRENMFLVLDNETGEHDFSLKPMNCPSHHLYFGTKKHSYRELPLRLRDLRRVAPERGLRRARRTNASAAVPAGRLPRLPHGEPDRRRSGADRRNDPRGSTRTFGLAATLGFATRPEQRSPAACPSSALNKDCRHALERARRWSTGSRLSLKSSVRRNAYSAATSPGVRAAATAKTSSKNRIPSPRRNAGNTHSWPPGLRSRLSLPASPAVACATSARDIESLQRRNRRPLVPHVVIGFANGFQDAQPSANKQLCLQPQL